MSRDDVMINDKKKIRKTFAMSLILLLLTILILAILGRAEKKRNILQAEYVMISEISKIQYAIDSRLLNAEILEMLIVNNHGIVTDFEMIAERLYEDDTAIRSLQLAPDGIVTYVYPLAGNEKAFGNIFDSPERRAEAEYARDTGKMTLAGPYELSQGGMGLVARNPIYLESGQQEKAFWGFSVAVLNVPEIFNKAELENLSDQGYDYLIYKILPESGERQIISSNTDGDMAGAIVDEISVPNGTWFFSMQPKEGWISWKNTILEIMIAIVIDTLLILLTYGGITILQQKRRMTELANTDSLTGLYNVRYFMSTVKRLAERQHPFGVLYLDLDRFKEVNDRYGHDIGDKLLTEVSSRIRSCLRKEDLLFRIGGDEFSIVIQDESSCEYYNSLIGQITESIARPYSLSDIVLYPGISCGYARYPDDQSDIDPLIKEADRNMYVMKNKQSADCT